MPLNEIQRQEYLETMGIQSYFPRYILPSAKESVQCPWPQGFEATIAEETAPKARSLSKVVVEPKAVPDTKLAVEPELAKTRPAESIEAVVEVRFQLAFIRVNESFSILNQIPYIGSNHLSSPHRSLLLNLLKSLKLNSDNLIYDELSFRWPISEGKHVDKSEQAARQSLNSYLEQKQSSPDSSFKRLLVMGGMAGSYISAEQSSWQLTCTRSLDEMLTMPQIKRDVWQQLRVLSLNSAG